MPPVLIMGRERKAFVSQPLAPCMIGKRCISYTLGGPQQQERRSWGRSGDLWGDGAGSRYRLAEGGVAADAVVIAARRSRIPNGLPTITAVAQRSRTSSALPVI